MFGDGIEGSLSYIQMSKASTSKFEGDVCVRDENTVQTVCFAALGEISQVLFGSARRMFVGLKSDVVDSATEPLLVASWCYSTNCEAKLPHPSFTLPLCRFPKGLPGASAVSRAVVM